MKDALGLKYTHEVEGEEGPLEMIEGVKTLIAAIRPWIKSTSPSTRELVLGHFLSIVDLCSRRLEILERQKS